MSVGRRARGPGMGRTSLAPAGRRRTRGAAPLALCLLMAAACDRREASAPTRAAAPATPSIVLPLGAAAVVDVSSGVDSRVAPRIDAWGQTVAVAWVDGAGWIRIAMSPDAGRTFPDEVLLRADSRGAATIDLAVRAPADLSRPSNDGRPDSRVEVWCRVGSGPAAAVVRSTNGGRSFDAPIPPDVTFSDVFPEPWELTSATTTTTLALLPPPLLRYVGVQQAARPAAAVDRGLPPMTLDEHGALAMLWRERTSAGDAHVLRRYAVDWNGTDPHTPEFDAPTTLLPPGQEVLAPALARVPGGIVVSWVTNGALRTRRLGLDMTCNPNRVR